MSQDPTKARTVGIWIIAIVAICVALFFAREILAPVAFAFLFSVVLRPPVRWFEKVRIPTWIGASIVMLAVIGLMMLALFLLSAPFQRWMEQAPQSISAAEQKLGRIRDRFAQVSEVASKLEHAAQGPTSGPTAHAPAPPPAPGGGMMARLFGGTTRALSGIVEVLLLLLLLLASGDLFYQKLLKILPFRDDKRIAITAVNEVQGVVRRYLVVTAIINLGQGTLVALVFWWLGMPSPILWGVFTFVLEFIPYLGAALMILMIALVSFTSFDSIGHVLAPPGAYLLITTIQNNLVSPIAYGNKLKLNPVAVLIGVMIWWFLWGIPGAFLAVPIIATIKIIADRTQGLNALGEFLGE
ncbi:MAG TPA: AI-2E family transporter [Tepidisphaeraceae bacterium]|nr:AI-2E family transporter [Tepidisphaeraceae bacterium]